MTENTNEPELGGHWDGLERLLGPGSGSDVQRAARKGGFPWSRKARHARDDDEPAEASSDAPDPSYDWTVAPVVEPAEPSTRAAENHPRRASHRNKDVHDRSGAADDPAAAASDADSPHARGGARSRDAVSGPDPADAGPSTPFEARAGEAVSSGVESFGPESFGPESSRAGSLPPGAERSDPAVEPAGADRAVWRPAVERSVGDRAYEGFESWVPPWARELPAEPPVSYTEEEMALGRFAYADADGESLPDPDSFEPGMVDSVLRGALEAILMVINEPATPVVLAQVLEEPTGRIERTLHALHEEYANAGRGFELRQVAGGWRFYTRGEYSSYVERFVLDGQHIRLTQAALETLAVVAYKQPVTRSRVAAIRGVNCDGVIKTLVTRGLVEECGAEHESGAHLYRTTNLFLEKVGINSVDELPPIAPFLPTDIDEFDLAQR